MLLKISDDSMAFSFGFVGEDIDLAEEEVSQGASSCFSKYDDAQESSKKLSQAQSFCLSDAVSISVYDMRLC